MQDILGELMKTLKERRRASPDTSYVARLYRDAPAGILKKIGEEAAEVIIADGEDAGPALRHEIADLWFHTLVLLAYRGIEVEEILAELASRHGVSGLAEKAERREKR